MQEEVENKTLTLVINGSKLTGRMLKSAISKYLAHRKEVKHQKRQTDVIPHGKQTVKQLIGQNQGVSNIEINDPFIKEFDRIARKYGVDYAIKRDRSSNPPKFLVFFKSRNADALTAAFNEYAGKKVRKASNVIKLRNLSSKTSLKRFEKIINSQEVANIFRGHFMCYSLNLMTLAKPPGPRCCNGWRCSRIW